MEFLSLFVKTLWLRPYVFFFLGVSLIAAMRFFRWKRTAVFFGLTWITAFVCEFASTRIGFPFGEYFYTGSTVGQELYLFNIPFMDSLSFTFLLYASYCLALIFVLPYELTSLSLPRRLVVREPLSWPVIGLTCLFFMLIDVVIDPVALQGGRWFLGEIYGYPDPGAYFGIPLANFAGWYVVGLISMVSYRWVDRQTDILPDLPGTISLSLILLGCGLYYAILFFNLGVTFWIGEGQMGIAGCFIHLPVAIFLWLKLANRLPSPA